jgi:hypothetical protein
VGSALITTQCIFKTNCDYEAHLYPSSAIAPLPRNIRNGAKCLNKCTNFRPVVTGNIDHKKTAYYERSKENIGV